MGTSPFLAADGGPRLVDCATLFFDLLGVSAKANGQGAEEELRQFDKTIREALPYPIGEEALRSPWEASAAAVFSDSLIVAVPVDGDLTPAEAIVRLIFDINQLQHSLSTYGYFGRGAITFDRLHFNDGLVFGPALVEAVELERGVARDPRIVLSPAATIELRKGLRGEGAPTGTLGEPAVLLDEDGLAFVDYLSGAFQADPEFDLPEQLARHRDTVSGELGRNLHNFERWSKYRWVAEYHNAICAEYADLLDEAGGRRAFLIDQVHTGRRFAPLPA
jgi:hypothetical protein